MALTGRLKAGSVAVHAVGGRWGWAEAEWVIPERGAGYNTLFKRSPPPPPGTRTCTQTKSQPAYSFSLDPPPPQGEY